MKKLIPILALAAACLTAQSQTAKVIALSDADAAKAKSLFQQRAELDKQIEELKAKIEKHYMSAAVLPNGGCGDLDRVIVIPGSYDRVCLAYDWINGFEYSDDYRFIVPKFSPPAAKSSCFGGTVLTDSLTPFTFGSASAVGHTDAPPDLFYHEINPAPSLVGHAIDPVQEMSDAIKTCTAHIDQTVHLHNLDFEPITATCRDIQKATCEITPNHSICSVVAD